LDLQNLGREVAISHLDSMGLDCGNSANGVQFRHGECRFDIQETSKLNDGTVAVLTFAFATQNTLVEELLIGWGKNEEEAVANGVCEWMCGMVAPVVALYEPKLDLKKWGCRRVSIMSNTGDRYRNWDVVLGQVLSNDQDGYVYAQLESNPPFGMALNAVTARLHEEQLHWAKVYLMRSNTNELIGEVRVDNEVDQSAMHQLQAFRWPPTTQSPIWFRQFSALAPGEEVSKQEFEALMAQTQQR
jgi:hypothetical protein